jgi:hypothetical protein
MLLPDDGIIKMSSAQVPRLQATARGILVVGFDSAVGSFGYQDGSTRVFEYTFDPISSCSAITMDSSGPGYKLPQRKLEWSSASGVIVRGDDQKFLVERSNGALFPKITSIDSLGVRSTFQINAAAATVTKTTGGVGSKVQYYFASPGALYMKTRKVERFQEGVTAPIQSLRWRYDASGALIEE